MIFAEINMIGMWGNELNAMKVSRTSLGINPWRNDFDSARNLHERFDFSPFFLLFQIPSVILNCAN